MLSVRDNAYDNLNKRAFASKYQKLFVLPPPSSTPFEESQTTTRLENETAICVSISQMTPSPPSDIARRCAPSSSPRERPTPPPSPNASPRFVFSTRRLRPPPPTSLEATRSFCTDHLVRSIRTRTTPSSFGATVASFSGSRVVYCVCSRRARRAARCSLVPSRAPRPVRARVASPHVSTRRARARATSAHHRRPLAPSEHVP